MRKLIYLMLVAMLLPLASQAQDSRLTSFMNRAESQISGYSGDGWNVTNLNYEVDEDGDYKLVVKFSDGRTQLVFLISKTYETGGTEVREIWAPVHLDASELSSGDLTGLMSESNGFILGSYEILSESSVILNCKVPVGLDDQTLVETIVMTAVRADEKEKELNGGTDEL